MANRRTSSNLDRLSFGGRVPWAIGLILVLTIATSLTAALGSRHVLPLFELGSLVADRVFHGEIWRMVTWSVLEPSPISLLFVCLFLYWFGRDLAGVWGSRRFLNVYVGIAAIAAVGTCLIALVDRAIVLHPYVGSWPLVEAITVAWGLWFPDRIVRFYLIFQIRGYTLAWLTIAFTVVYAIYSGWDHYVPNLLAEGSMLAYVYRGSLVSRWSKWRHASQASARQAQARTKKEGQRMATVHVLRAIEAKDDDLPPLSPEIEGQLGKLIASKKDPPKRDDDDKSN